MINFKINRAFKLFKKIKQILIFSFILLITTLFLSAKWINKKYNNSTFNDILFHIFVPLKTEEKKLKTEYINNVLIVAIMLSIALTYINNFIYKNIIKNKEYVLGVEKFKIGGFFKIVEQRKKYIAKFLFFKKKIAY